MSNEATSKKKASSKKNIKTASIKRTGTKTQKNNMDKWKIILKNFLAMIKKLVKKLFYVICKFLKRYWQLILMNIIIFILTVFIESIYIYNLKFLMWVANTFLFVIIPTVFFTLKFNIKSKDIVLSIPMLYILFLIFLDFCTLRDLYGITSGRLDKVPNFIDALMVVFIFTFLEYITAYAINKLRNNKQMKKIKK